MNDILCFENTRALDGDDAESCRITTTADDLLLADRVIVATHLPFLDRAGFFGRVGARGPSCRRTGARRCYIRGHRRGGTRTVSAILAVLLAQREQTSEVELPGPGEVRNQ